MRKDFVLNREGKVIVGQSDQEHAKDIIEIDKGWNKFFPEHGVGAMRYVKGKRKQEFHYEITINLKADGYDPKILGDKKLWIGL